MNTFSTISCLVLFVCLVASTCKGQEEPPFEFPVPPTCERFECVNYEIVYSQKGLEIRDYKNTSYVYTEVPAKSYKEGASQGFKRLFDYFDGKNRVAFRLAMTAPVIVGVKNSTYTTHFFLPRKYQGFVPGPLTDDIKSSRMPYLGHKYAAVGRFDGVIDDESIATNVDALKRIVVSSPYKRAASSAVSVVAAYNSPRETTNRVNEILIWFD